MRRRQFITLLGGASAWPLATRAQQTGKLPIIGHSDPDGNGDCRLKGSYLKEKAEAGREWMM